MRCSRPEHPLKWRTHHQLCMCVAISSAAGEGQCRWLVLMPDAMWTTAVRVCFGESAISPDAGLVSASCDPQCMLLQRRLIEAPEEDEDSGPATSAKLQTLRLTREEMGFKTVPLVSGLDAATAADLQALPEVRQSGSFSAFTLLSANPKQQWVVSPPDSPCTSQMPTSRHTLQLPHTIPACAYCGSESS